MGTVEHDLAVHDREQSELQRAEYLEDDRQAAVRAHLELMLSLDADAWSRMICSEFTPEGWEDDDEFHRQLGRAARLAFENGMGV